MRVSDLEGQLAKIQRFPSRIGPFLASSLPEQSELLWRFQKSQVFHGDDSFGCWKSTILFGINKLLSDLNAGAKIDHITAR
jgi:hypothetical protein